MVVASLVPNFLMGIITGAGLIVRKPTQSLRLCLDNRFGEWFSKGKEYGESKETLSFCTSLCSQPLHCFLLLIHNSLWSWSKHSLNLLSIFIFRHALTLSRILYAGNNDDDRWFFPFAGWPSQTILALPGFIHQLWGMGATGIYFNHGYRIYFNLSSIQEKGILPDSPLNFLVSQLEMQYVK